MDFDMCRDLKLGVSYVLTTKQFAHIPTNTFYNNTHAEDITGPKANHKCSIYHWSDHGIAGRGILLDYRGFAHKNGIIYDPYEAHRITYEQLYQCGREQGIDIRPEAQGGDVRIGDLLFIRSGFIEAYNSKPSDERARLATRPHQVGPDDGQRWAGVAQEVEVLDWLHDCCFAAVGGDAPAFEAWPTAQGKFLRSRSSFLLNSLCRLPSPRVFVSLVGLSSW